MYSYTIDFLNVRKSQERQARKKFYKNCSENSQISNRLPNRYFPKLVVGCPRWIRFWFFILLLTIVGLNQEQKTRQFINIADLDAFFWIHFCKKKTNLLTKFSSRFTFKSRRSRFSLFVTMWDGIEQVSPLANHSPPITIQFLSSFGFSFFPSL